VAFPARIETDRLILRRWREDDHAALAAIWADSGVWAALRPSTPYDPAAATPDTLGEQLRHWAAHGFGVFALEERNAGREVIGWAGPWHPSIVPALEHEVEIGWTLRQPYWGRGLATEAAVASAEATFEHLGLDAVISLIRPENARSIAVAQRLGMHVREAVTHAELGTELLVHTVPRTAWERRGTRG